MEKTNPCADEPTIKVLKMLIRPGWRSVTFVLMFRKLSRTFFLSLKNAVLPMLFYFEIIFFSLIHTFIRHSFIRGLFCD